MTPGMPRTHRTRLSNYLKRPSDAADQAVRHRAARRRHVAVALAASAALLALLFTITFRAAYDLGYGAGETIARYRAALEAIADLSMVGGHAATKLDRARKIAWGALIATGARKPHG